MIWPHGQCGHFALSTLLETWLKDAVCETNVKTYITRNGEFKNSKMQNYYGLVHVKFLTFTKQQEVAVK